jgi:hypothetical protein
MSGGDRGFELPELDILEAIPGEFWPVLLAVVVQRAEVVR